MITDEHFHLPKPEPYQRLGSGDGEGWTLLTRQMPFEPLPASVLLALGGIPSDLVRLEVILEVEADSGTRLLGV